MTVTNWQKRFGLKLKYEEKEERTSWFN